MKDKLKKTTVYLVRHGEVHNPEDIYYARLPGFKLSKRGEREATNLAEHLKSKSISTIYTSPLERTRQTAGYLAARKPDIPVVYDDRLLEVRTPVQGTKFDILRPTGINIFSDALIAQGGETMEDIWKRMNAFLEEVRNKHMGEEIAAFSHGDPIMITRAALEGKPLQLSSIRGEYYVGHAKGVVITIHGANDSTTEDIVY